MKVILVDLKDCHPSDEFPFNSSFWSLLNFVDYFNRNSDSIHLLREWSSFYSVRRLDLTWFMSRTAISFYSFEQRTILTFLPILEYCPVKSSLKSTVICLSMCNVKHNSKYMTLFKIHYLKWNVGMEEATSTLKEMKQNKTRTKRQPKKTLNLFYLHESLTFILESTQKKVSLELPKNYLIICH